MDLNTVAITERPTANREPRYTNDGKAVTNPSRVGLDVHDRLPQPLAVDRQPWAVHVDPHLNSFVPQSHRCRPPAEVSTRTPHDRPVLELTKCRGLRAAIHQPHACPIGLNPKR